MSGEPQMLTWAPADVGQPEHDCGCQYCEVKEEREVVYFVLAEHHVKIGTTTRLRERLVELNRGQQPPPLSGQPPFGLRLLFVEEGGRDREALWHDRFKEDRVPGTEWFQLSNNVRKVLGLFLFDQVFRSRFGRGSGIWDA